MLVTERNRLEELTIFEREALSRGHIFPVGIDEAGRGPLAGPVTAAACYIPEGVWLEGVDDSKKLTAKSRERIFESLISNPQIHFAYAEVSSKEIDEINILQATIRAMLQAVESMDVRPDYLLVDGLFLAHPEIPGEKIIKGDQRSQSIAAASVIAKVVRDRKMREYDVKWPEYGFAKHKGYGTRQHVAAIHEHGPCPIHRRSFAPIRSLVAGVGS